MAHADITLGLTCRFSSPLLVTLLVVVGLVQGCPIGIPKNPEISGSSRKKFTRCAPRNTVSLKSGGGGGSSRTQYEKIRGFVKKIFFFP